MKLDACTAQLKANLGNVVGMKRAYDGEPEFSPTTADCPCAVVYEPSVEIVGFANQKATRALAYKFHFNITVALAPTGIEEDALTVTTAAFSELVLSALYGHLSLNGNAFDSEVENQFKVDDIVTIGAQTYVGFTIPWAVLSPASITVAQ